MVNDICVTQVQDQDVHNLTIERRHTFAVGTLGVLAHNESWCDQLVRQFPERFKGIPQALKDNLAKINAARRAAGLDQWPDGAIHGHHLVMKGKELAKRAQEILRKYKIPLLHNQTDLTELKRAIERGKEGKEATVEGITRVWTADDGLANMSLAINWHNGIHGAEYADFVNDALEAIVARGKRKGLTDAEIRSELIEQLNRWRESLAAGEYFWRV